MVKGVVAGIGAAARKTFEITMAELPGPDVVWRKREQVIGFAQEAVIHVIADFGTEGEPTEGPDIHVRIDFRKRVLAVGAIKPPIGVDGPIQQVVDALTSPLRLDFVAQAEADDVLSIDGIDGVVIGKFDGQQARGRNAVIELRQLARADSWVRHIDVIDRRLDDVPNAIDMEKRAFGLAPQTRELEGRFGAGVEDAAVFVIGHAAFEMRFAVMGEAAADAWSDVEPAEKGMGQSNLVEGVDACGGVWEMERIGVVLAEFALEISEGTVALVIERRHADLLSKPGEFDVGQAFDGLEEIVDARLDHGVHGEIGPTLVQIDEGVWLDVVAIFAFEEIPHDELVALVTNDALGGEVGVKVDLMARPDAVTVLGNGLVREGVFIRLQVVRVVALEHAFAKARQGPFEIRAEADAALVTAIEVDGAFKLLFPIPLVGGEQIGAKNTAVAWRECDVVGVLFEAAVVIREVENGHLADVKDGVARLDVFAGHDDNVFGANFVSGALGVIVGGHRTFAPNVNAGFVIAGEHFAFGEVRALASAEIRAEDFAGVKVVAHVFAAPDVALALEVNIAFGVHEAGLFIRVGFASGKGGAAVFDNDAVGDDDRAGGGVVVDKIGRRELDAPICA